MVASPLVASGGNRPVNMLMVVVFPRKQYMYAWDQGESCVN